jgi:transposase-like protein
MYWLMKGFLGLHDFLERFGTNDRCSEWLRLTRWPGGFFCPRCGEKDRVSYIKTRHKHQCNACRYQCSLIAGTIFENTKLPLTKWFLAAYLILTTKKGISTPELARKLDVAESTAWFLEQKILLVLGQSKDLPLFGIVEADETFIGGKKPGTSRGRGTTKETVVGLVEVGEEKLGRVRLHHVPDASGIMLEAVIREELKPGATLRTDGWRGYNNIPGYTHEPRRQQKGREGRDLPAIHLVFSNLKKIIKGVHTHISPQKLQTYLDLYAYRFNWRNDLWGGFYNASLNLTKIPPRRYQQLRAATPE